MGFIKKGGMAFLVLTLTFVCSALVQAEDGVSDEEIVLGSSLALEGDSGYLGTQVQHGAMSYINSINDKGGINKRKLRVISLNDSYDPAKCESNTRELIEKNKVFALINYVGTATSLKALPLAQKAHIPLFAPYTGAEELRNPIIPEVFNVRASYNEETEGIVTHFWNKLGVRKFAVFYQNDAYGKDALKGVELALQKLGSKPVVAASYERGNEKIADVLKTIRQAQPEAVIMAGTYGPSARFVQSAKWSSFSPYFHSLSFVGAEEFARLIGAGRDSDGVIVTQIVSPPSIATPAKKEYVDLLKKYYPEDKPNFASFEGFINAKVLVEILTRMGKNVTHENFIKTAESLKNFDIGIEDKISFSPTNHQGCDTVYYTIIENGKYQLIKEEDWSSIQKLVKGK